MKNTTMFPREEHADVLFQKILNDPWACEKLQGTFCNSLFCNEDNNFPLSPDEFSQALFNAYHNRDLSAFLMAICQNTLFDLLRNSFLIPYRFNADGRTNPIIMTDESGNLLPGYKTTVHEKNYQHFYDVYCDLDNKKNSYLIPYRFNADGKTNPVIMTDENGVLLPEFKNCIHEKEYQHFREVYNHFDGKKKMYLAQAYRYSHSYRDDDMNIKQQVLEKNTGVLIIRELPDTVKLKETEAEAYSAVWDLMIKLEKSLPMAYIFYGQDSLVEENTRYDEIGIFLPDSLFLKNLERHVKKAEAIIYAEE